jgi:hypothetical protein
VTEPKLYAKIRRDKVPTEVGDTIDIDGHTYRVSGVVDEIGDTDAVVSSYEITYLAPARGKEPAGASATFIGGPWAGQSAADEQVHERIHETLSHERLGTYVRDDDGNYRWSPAPDR